MKKIINTYIRIITHVIVFFCALSCMSVYDELENNMIRVPEGAFSMGSSDSLADDDEKPVTQMFIKSFRLSKYEVSQRLWVKVMRKNPSQNIGKNLPVECVSVDDINLFIKKLNTITGKQYRLPTEAEWEYAASFGPDSQEEGFEDQAWFYDNSDTTSHELGLKKPNSIGLYDMIGNVNEWCSGIYDGKDYSGNVVTAINHKEEEAVFRGGAFNVGKKFCRRANRNHTLRSMRNYAIGFRLAESIHNN